jgi:hypothetical protein
MSGNPANANIWADADVYVSTNLSAALPASASAPFGVGWDLVGLLDGEAGMSESRTEDVKDHYAWGGLLVATSRSKFKLTKKFTVLEDNAVTRSLIWPGSAAGEIIVPRPAKILVAFEVRDRGQVKRAISANYAEVTVDGDLATSETDLSKVTLMATIFPTSAGKLFTTQDVPALTSIAITPLTLALAVAGIKSLVATATYSDASTGVITDQASWSTSNPAKATVRFGDVTGVAAGSANISCTYGGVTATAPSVVTVT